MENASKALIIAGAILISFGVAMMGSADGMRDRMTGSMSEQEISAFNSDFLQYEGTNKTATEVKNMLNKIATSNSVNEATSADDDKWVELEATINAKKYSNKAGSAAGISEARAAVRSTKRYSITCTVNSGTGLVEKVTISET